MDAGEWALLLLFISLISGTVIWLLILRAAKGREQAVPQGLNAVHAGLTLTIIPLWLAWVGGGEDDLDDVPVFVAVMIAFLLGAGLLMLGRILKARRDDPEGDRYGETRVNLMHVAGHTVLGLAAVAAVVVATVQA